MSNSTDTTGCISHRQFNRFFIMFEDFLDVAKISEHHYKLAAFWRVLETKTNDRITTIPEIAEDCKKRGVSIPEEHLWIEIPYSEFVNRALGVYKSSSFQVAAAESERLGFSKSRQLKRPVNPNDPNSPMEDYKEYLFLTDVMQSVLNGGEYPPPIEINSPLLNSIAARKQAQKDKKEKRAIENNTPPIDFNSHPTETAIEINSTPLLNSIGNKYITKNSKDESKNEGTPASAIPQRDDSLLPSSTPSLSSGVEHLSTNVDNSVENKQTVIQVDTHPIATTTTPSSPPSHRNTEQLDPLAIYDEDEKQQHYWWCRFGLPVKVNLTNKGYWRTLSEFVHSFEQFESLFKYTEKQLEDDPKIPDKTVNPGNLANAKYLSGWVQAERRSKYKQQKQQEQPKKTMTIADLASRPISSLPRL